MWMRVLAWAAGMLAPHPVGAEWLATGTYLYAVSIARTGRIIEVVRVRADSEEEAALKAVRYVAANIYAMRVTRQEEAHADR